MKVSLKELEERSFKPFEINIKIESIDELLSLIHRFDASVDVFINTPGYEPSKELPENFHRSYQVWNLLNRKLEESKK